MEHSQSGMTSGHGRHMLIMALCCLIPLAGIFAISAFGIPLTGVLRYALVLICPLGMVLMMVMTRAPAQGGAAARAGVRGEHSHGKSAGDAEAGPQDEGASCH